MKRILDLMILLVMTGLTALAQPNYDYSRLSMEALDRGVVAVRQADGRVFVSWRSLKSDPKNLAFDVYRNGEKLNAEPLTKGTWFIDEKPVEEGVYEVVCEGQGARGKGQEDTSNLRSAEGRLLPE